MSVVIEINGCSEILIYCQNFHRKKILRLSKTTNIFICAELNFVVNHMSEEQ